jgi:very-short-patch-repair endonuclease
VCNLKNNYLYHPNPTQMPKRKIIPYNPKLTDLARKLRNESTETEIFLWLKLKGKQMYGYDFHRQKPIDNYILDFFCHELLLGIEVDGYSHEILEVYNKDIVKEKRMNDLGITILRFSDFEVLKDMENVIRAIEFYILEFEKIKLLNEHTPNPSLEGNRSE